jgi:4'-phosphopantetheinyl transferase
MGLLVVATEGALPQHIPAGAFPALQPDVIHAWLIDLPACNRLQGHLWHSLSADEQERASRFHFERDHRRFVVARGALRDILAHYLDCSPSLIRFEYGSFGKPRLAAPTTYPIHFNLAHSSDLALCAVSLGREVGVDLERVNGDLDFMPLAERFFAPGEYETIRLLPAGQQLSRFFDYWTCKEAYVKARGNGLALDLHTFDLSGKAGETTTALEVVDNDGMRRRWWIHSLTCAPEYAAAIAFTGPPSSLGLRRWPAPLE